MEQRSINIRQHAIILLKILAITFLFEILVTVFLSPIIHNDTHTLREAFLEAFWYTFIISPFLWILIVRPIHIAADREIGVAEDLVAQNQQDWEDVFNTITDMITVHDKDFNIIRANKAAEKILKLPLLADMKAKCFSFYHGTESPPLGCPSCQCLQTVKPCTSEVFEPHLNRFIEIRAIPRLDRSEQVVGLIHVVRDITERNRMEKELLNNTNRLTTIINTVPECVSLVSPDGSLLEMNTFGLGIVEAASISQLAGKSLYTLIAPEYRAAYESVNKAVFQGSTSTLEYEIIGLKGTRRWVETRCAPLRNSEGAIIANLCVSRDNSEHKKLEAQLRHAHKMEAIGTLTGGIAHDFNNILTAIIGYGNILKLKIKPDDPIRAYVDQVLASTERATGLTQSLLAFSRKVVVTMRPVSLNDTVTRVEKLLHRLISENIELTTSLNAVDATIIADSGQIEQVLMNLVTNARDAMPDGGKLHIATGITSLGSDFINAYGYGKDGDYASVTVIDSGTGMDDKTRDRIFEPFFTTKEVGKGTGLGLSIVYGIIKQHNGYITCSSKLGHGSIFTLYLPLVRAVVPEQELKGSLMPRGGTETILIAEDDSDVRNLIGTVLRNFGYTIIEAEDGEVAVARFNEHKDGVHLLLVDAMMPRMDGKHAYDAIRAMKPSIKVLFMSGYNVSTMHEKGIMFGENDYLLKPISPEVLLQKIREVLDK